MPYIRISLSCPFTSQQLQEAKAAFGRDISILPGKAEANLMLLFEEAGHMFFKGEQDQHMAFIDCRLFGTQGTEAKKAYTDAVLRRMKEIFDIEPQQVYMAFTHYDDWASGFGYKHL